MKGKRYGRDSGRVVTAEEIANAAGINSITLFYNVKLIRELIRNVH